MTITRASVLLLIVCSAAFLAAGAVVFNPLAAAAVENPTRPLLYALLLFFSLAVLAGFVALNARLWRRDQAAYQEQGVRVEQLSSLNSILSVLSVTLSLDNVLDTILSSATVLSEARGVAIFLLSPKPPPQPLLERAAGMSEAFLRQAPTPLIFENANRITLGEQPPMIVVDVRTHPKTAHLRELMIREGKLSWIELPLAVGGLGTGALVLYFDRLESFEANAGAERIELLRAFANQAGQAISNARLYSRTDESLERRIGQMIALAAMTHELTAAIDQSAICDAALKYAMSATHAARGSMILLGESGTVETLATRGFAEGAFTESTLSGLAAQSIAEERTIRINSRLDGMKPSDDDEAVGGEYTARINLAHSRISTPIVRNGAALGALTLESDQEGAFTEEEASFVAQLAAHTVIAIDSARLFRRVAEARDRMSVVLNTMDEAIVMISPTGMVSVANPRVAMIGLSPTLLVDQPMEMLITDESLRLVERFGFRQADEVRALMRDLCADDHPACDPFTYTVEGESGVISVRRQAARVSDSQGRALGVMLVFYDETETVRMAQTREDLSRMLVHDLRSPLTAIMTGLKILNDAIPTDSPQRPTVEATTDASRQAIHKMLHRVDAILDVSRMESGLMTLDSKPTDIETLIDSVCAEISPLANEQNIVLNVEMPPDGAPLLLVDGDKIERLLLNLVDNALKYGPFDSTVTIRAHAIGQDDAAPGFVRIDVRDQGPGIPDDYRTRLFDRYVQIKGRKGNRRGVGLGLTFCRMVTEAHGGRIWVENNPTGGSVFAFTLPIAPEPALATGEMAAAPPS